ncbi:hypothetical protein vseg_015662 [Gypsophila vaccaria]
MSNPGIGNRFAAVNLNKSYGQVANPNQSNTGGGGYGMGRGRGGGGGMVVLSRPRSAHKAAPKLSVPPPLNLPSLRKEHEKFDTLGAGSGGGGGGGSGVRPSSSGLGWSKPSAIVAVERDEVGGGGGDRPLSSEGGLVSDVVGRGGGTSAYVPPSARGGDVAVAAPMEKVSVLRGEDFPSLRATLNAANGQTQKQMDSAQQKHRHGASEESSGGLREGLQASSLVTMQPQMQAPRYSADNNAGGDDRNGGNSRPQEQGRKQDDFFPGPLPLVRLSPRSDWADDERDTSHGLNNRSRDHGYSRTEAYWDRDFDFPLNNFGPHKPAQYQFDRRGQRDNDIGKGLSNEVSNADPFVKNGRAPSSEGRQGHSWRSSMASDGFGSQDVVNNNRNNLGPRHMNREINKENKYIPPQSGGSTRGEHVNGGFTVSDLGDDRRDQGYRHTGRQQWNNSADPNNSRGADRNFQQHYVSYPNRYRADSFQNNIGARSSFPASGKGLSVSDHLPNFSRDKRSFSKSEKTYVEDPFLSSTNFDGQDPFSGNILGVVKRKKDSNKMLDFHDPVRESFEAELERVQKIQEQERQRVIEEQERAIEMARREEEERLRVLREQEEHQRRMEEEAREAAWRAEHEKLEVMRRAEELKIAREEEKQRMMMEEERRKQAAKQKLLELEERIARRQAESSKADSSVNSGDIMTGAAKDRDFSRPDDFANWEDGERMVERITNSASSDSSLMRPFDMGSRDASFSPAERGKSFNSWRRDIFDNGNNSSFFSVDHENGHLSPRREAAMGGRSFPRKDLYSGQGYMPSSGHYPGGVPEPHMDDFPHARGHRWNLSGPGDPYGRNMDFGSDFHDTVADKFDVGWGQSRGRGYTPFPDRLYHNADLDEFYSHGRSRYPARQPRVLPPPALSSGHRTSFRNESDPLGSSSYEDVRGQFNHAQQGDSNAEHYQNVQEENSDVIDVHEQKSTEEEQELNKRTVPGCDSQSSLSVSSPPSSPTQLSHDDFDDSRESLPVSGVAEGQDVSLFENEADVLAGKGNLTTAASSISVGDDEEWTVENIEVSQDQEEYDEDVGYHVEGEVHGGGEGENSELAREFEEMHLEEKDSSDMTENLVLGFDQGVEVAIPNDDHEKIPMDDDSLCVGPEGIVMKQNVDGLGDRQSPQVGDALLPVVADSSSVIADETDKALQRHVSEPNSASAQPSSSAVHDQQSVPSLPNTDSQSSNQSMPKFQFGLFSGPSLIPSPVPAIQIGSIQMPLQLHPHIGPPLPHLHTSQPPLFQFGQLRYPASMSQGIMSLAPQSMSYVQPNVAHNFASNQVPGSRTVQDSSSPCPGKSDGPSFTMNIHPMQPSNQSGMCQQTELKEANLPSVPSSGSNVPSLENQVDASTSSVNAAGSELGQRTDNFTRNSKPILNNRTSESRSQGRSSSHRSASNVRNSVGPAANQFPASRGRRFAYSSRNPDGRLTSPSNEVVRSDANGYQRRPRRITQRFEFRVRQTADGNQSALEAQSNSGTQLKSGLNKEIQLDKPKLASNSSSDKIFLQDAVSVIEEDKCAGKLAVTHGLDTSHQEGSLKRNITSEDDVDAPLQSGVVRVYRQPGIEVPSDEDDFIEVRSKRQMLNDRREQREKESKAKTSNMRKPQRKPRAALEGTSAASPTRLFALSNTQAPKSSRAVVRSRGGLLNNETSAGFSNVGSQPLAPVGTSLLSSEIQTNAKAQSVRPVQRGSYTAAKQTVQAARSDMTSDGPKKVDSAQSSLGSWGASSMNQSVMTLTQTQLEEAMKPACSDTNTVSVRDQSTSLSESIMPSSSVPKSTSFSSAASPISSLLAGENIQFGAVTSSAIIPSSTHVVSQGTRPSALPSLENRTSQKDCEAEAAASAIAVAAIGNDEVVGNGIGNASVDKISAGISGDQHTIRQSKAEETLSVSLPADLSVETPPISIWPPLPSPHSSSSQMVSQFPGGPTSHFPFYDMNPMMGGPLFAFGPTDESAGSLPQPQKNSAPSSGPLGTWQQCHAGVDSLYGPAGFTAPFISTPGSISGVQGPPHMVVYNHFASLGQFGQVGLSYMGTTYVPSGKQPDWKHNPTSASMGGTEGETNNVNMVPVLRNAPNVPAQAPHLAPGSPLFSIPSPLPMYEVSPFQSSTDMPIHPRWPHVQASSDPTIPQPAPSQQRAEVTVPSQFSHGSSHPSATTNGFSKPQTSQLVDGCSFSVDPNTGTPSVPSASEDSTPNAGNNSRFEDSGTNDVIMGGSVSKRNSQAAISASHKAQPAHQKNSSGYGHYQRGAGQKNGSGADWSNRKMGFRGRNYSSGGDRTFAPTTKVKQIYVAKQSTSGTSTDV